MANRNAGNINRLIVTSGILHLWLYAKQSRNGFTRLRRWVKNHMGNVELPQQRDTYGEPDAIGSAIEYAKHRSRSHDAVFTCNRLPRSEWNNCDRRSSE